MNEDLNLSREERIRFYTYCKRESEQCKVIAEQMMKLPGNVVLMSEMQTVKSKAYAIVAEDINPENWERFCKYS